MTFDWKSAIGAGILASLAWTVGLWFVTGITVWTIGSAVLFTILFIVGNAIVNGDDSDLVSGEDL